MNRKKLYIFIIDAILLAVCIIYAGVSLNLPPKNAEASCSPAEEITIKIKPTICFANGHKIEDQAITVSGITGNFVIYYSFLSENGHIGIGVSDVLNGTQIYADEREYYPVLITSDKVFKDVFMDSVSGKFQRNVVTLSNDGK